MPTTAYIALGSKLGDRRANLDRAVELLRPAPGIAVQKVSTYHEPNPVGRPAGQGKYLNAVAELTTDLEPLPLLQTLLGIEQQMGRVRSEYWGPRTIDLDLLLYGTEVVESHTGDVELTLPHPRMHERRFVLEPLVEIPPFAVHPVLGSTALDLLRNLDEPRELADQVALVTGATSGIGRAIALELAGAGARIVVHGRNQAKAVEVADACGQQSGAAHFLLAELRD